MKDIAICGSGGLARELACLIRLINGDKPQWRFIGYFNEYALGTSNEYGRVIGGIDDLNAWPTELSVIIGVGDPLKIRKIAGEITNSRVDFPNIIAPDCIFLDRDSLKIGRGNIICSHSLISCNVTIGDFNLLNGYAAVGHDAVIGNHNAIMPSVNISGSVTIGNDNFIGVGAAILQGRTVEDETRIGAGSVVIRRARSGNLYVGNPAVKIKI